MPRKKKEDLESQQFALMKKMLDDLDELPETVQVKIRELDAMLDKMPSDSKQWAMKFVEMFLELQSAMMMEELENQEYDDEDEIDDDADEDEDENTLCPVKLSAHVQKYTLRIELRGCSVPVWRRIEVPSNLTLAALEDVLIDIMGWENAHLSQFSKNRTYYMSAGRMDEEPDVFRAEDYTIADLLPSKGQSCVWEYDFGDSWRHEVKLSGVAEYKADEPQVLVFKAGQGNCPPEDCGGVWGYAELLELNQKRLSGKKLTRDEKDLLEYYAIDRNYDPNFLDEADCRDFVEYFNCKYLGQK